LVRQIRQALQVSPITLKYKHVLGHQDVKKNLVLLILYLKGMSLLTF
jgi:hypothetical protein